MAQEDTSFRDLVARLNAMSNLTPEEERTQLMEAARQEPRVLDHNDVSLADIARLAGIKEYTEVTSVSTKAKKLIESITQESSITKAIKESDADDSISATITKAVTEDSKRLDTIAELETKLAELKAEQKEEQTYEADAFREVLAKDIKEYINTAEATDLVELYNSISDNNAVYNEESSSILIKTEDTKEIIADAEKQITDAQDEQVDEKVKDFVDYDRNKEEPHTPEKDGGEEAEDKSDEKDTDGEVDMLDPEFDEGEAVELEAPAEVKFTNDLDPAGKK